MNIFCHRNHTQIFLSRNIRIHSIWIEMHNPLLNDAPIKVPNSESPAKC